MTIMQAMIQISPGYGKRYARYSKKMKRQISEVKNNLFLLWHTMPLYSRGHRARTTPRTLGALPLELISYHKRYLGWKSGCLGTHIIPLISRKGTSESWATNVDMCCLGATRRMHKIDLTQGRLYMCHEGFACTFRLQPNIISTKPLPIFVMSYCSSPFGPQLQWYYQWTHSPASQHLRLSLLAIMSTKRLRKVYSFPMSRLRSIFHVISWKAGF